VKVILHLLVCFLGISINFNPLIIILQHTKKESLKQFSYYFVITIIGLLASCNSKKKQQAASLQGGGRQQMTISVDAFIVNPTTVSESIEVPGTLLANETTEIHPEVPGRIVQLHVSEGRYVSKGALLAKLYDDDLQAQLKKLQVQLEIAKQTENRQSQLLKIQGISQQDYDISLLQVYNLKADIDIVQTAIRKTEIRAPFNGRLGLKNVSPGAFVTSANVITTISQSDKMRLDFTVPEKYTNRINTGQTVEFTVGGGGKIYTAKVAAREDMISENTRTLRIRADVQGSDAKLIPGTFAKVLLSFDPDPNALMVPSEAVLPQARGKKIITYNNGVANFRDVTTGIRDSSFVQITSGIHSGDTVVITGLLSIRPESKIKINKITNQ
jgi:membrane fusion protein (multidrug efflux system)